MSSFINFVNTINENKSLKQRKHKKKNSYSNKKKVYDSGYQKNEKNILNVIVSRKKNFEIVTVKKQGN